MCAFREPKLYSYESTKVLEQFVFMKFEFASALKNYFSAIFYPEYLLNSEENDTILCGFQFIRQNE